MSRQAAEQYLSFSNPIAITSIIRWVCSIVLYLYALYITLTNFTDIPFDVQEESGDDSSFNEGIDIPFI